MYQQEVREKTKKENPTADVKELAKIMGANWKGMKDSEKEKYSKKSSDAKTQYEKDFKIYNDGKK